MCQQIYNSTSHAAYNIQLEEKTATDKNPKKSEIVVFAILNPRNLQKYCKKLFFYDTLNTNK